MLNIGQKLELKIKLWFQKMIKIIYAKQNNEDKIIELCELALKYRLYVPGWTLRKILKDFIIGKGKIDFIAIAFEENIPIGIILINDEIRKNCIKIFVRKSKRRLGIGTKLVEKAKFHNKKLYGHPQCRINGQNFFIKNNVLEYKDFDYRKTDYGNNYFYKNTGK